MHDCFPTTRGSFPLGRLIAKCLCRFSRSPVSELCFWAINRKPPTCAFFFCVSQFEHICGSCSLPIFCESKEAGQARTSRHASFVSGMVHGGFLAVAAKQMNSFELSREDRGRTYKEALSRGRNQKTEEHSKASSGVRMADTQRLFCRLAWDPVPGSRAAKWSSASRYPRPLCGYLSASRLRLRASG